jgi:hypothetical protein
MEEWLFLDRIDMHCARIAVCDGIYFSIACNSTATESDITIIQQTSLWTFFALQSVGSF